MADPQPAKGKKLLGMPRTTGLVVIGLAALVVGYFVISKFGGGSSSSGSGGGQGGGGGGPGAGASSVMVNIRDWQGHGHRKDREDDGRGHWVNPGWPVR